MNTQDKARREKIQLLKDISSGKALIEDLDPCKVIRQEPDGTYTYKGKNYSSGQIELLKGRSSCIFITREIILKNSEFN